MNKKEYYVYGLIDPRDDQYFYIGKGKGKRYNSHLKESIKTTTNILKHSRIKEIEAKNLQVKTEILFPYLTENEALELEKIIIYKIGRESFREGYLQNFTPGGVWSPGESLFYETKPNFDFDLSLLDFVAQEKFLSIKKTSTIIHLDEINPKYFIYKYNLDGTLISIDNIACFFKNKNTIELFFEMNNENLPIYFGDHVYSKTPIIDFYFSPCFLSFNQFVFDPKFSKELDDNLKNKSDFTLELKQYNSSRIKVKFEKHILKIETFYPTNIIQDEKYLKDDKPFGKWIEYNENGELKCVKEHFPNGKVFTTEYYSDKGLLQYKNECFENGRIKKTWSYNGNGNLHWHDEHSADWKMVSRTFYHPNGAIKYSYNNFKHCIEYSYFSENGKLIEEYVNHKGFIKYNLDCEIISINSSKHMDFIDPFNILEISQTTVSSPNPTIEEKRTTDENWQLYNEILNSNLNFKNK